MERKWQIDRRTFLRGLGLSICLPYLEIMGGAKIAHAVGGPKRLVWIYIPNGLVMGGDGAPAPNYIRSLTSSISGKCNYITGLSTTKAGGGCHTDVIPYLTIGGNPTNVSGVGDFTVQNYPKTFDQHIAPVNRGQKFDTLSFSAREEPRDNCSTLNPLIYNHSSWTNTGPNYYIDSYFQPVDAFNRMFSGGTPATEVDTRVADQLRRKRGILHYVMEDITKLNRIASQRDKYVLDEYFSSIQTIEADISRQIASTPQTPTTGTCVAPTGITRLSTDDPTYHLRLKSFYDLMFVAIKCDMTRVITLKHAPENTQVFHKSFIPSLVGNCGWHTYSHYNDATANGEGAGTAAPDEASRIRDYETLTAWHYNHVADFVKKLNAEAGVGGGTLLDDCLVTWGSTLGYSNGHNMNNLFWQTAGSAGGRIRTGQTLALGGRPISDLWLTLMQAFGAPATRFGNSTGVISPIVGA